MRFPFTGVPGYSKMTNVAFCHFLPFKKAVFCRQTARKLQKTP
jgi:hypothetical protein